MKLQHPYLVTYLSLLRHKESGKIVIYLLAEDACGINLNSLHITFNNPAQIETIKHYLQQLTDVLGYLHQKSFVHGDLSPECIWISNCGCLKLSDYNLKAR